MRSTVIDGLQVDDWSQVADLRSVYLEPLPVYYDKLLNLGEWTPAHVQVLPVRYADRTVRPAVTVYTDEPWAPFTPQQAQELVDAVTAASRVVESTVLPQDVVDLTHAHYNLQDEGLRRRGLR